jgi:hypothetical protein
MAKQIITINKSTVRKNPMFGQTQILLKGRITCTFKSVGLPPNWINNNEVLITSISKKKGLKEVKGMITTLQAFEELDDATRRKYQIDTEIIENVEVFNLDSQSRYIFDYNDDVLSCDYCTIDFNFSELKSIVERDEDGNEHCILDICPNCNIPRCVDLDFENL